MAEENGGTDDAPLGLGPVGFVIIRIFQSLLTLVEKAHFIIVAYFVSRYTYLSLAAISGKTTNARIELNSNFVLFENVNSYLLGTLGVLILIIIVLMIRTSIMNQTLKRYKRKTGGLEQEIMADVDENRGSSNLTDTGTTNTEDKL